MILKSNNQIKMKSPLRYPGGKSRAVKHILPLIKKACPEKEICSPFLGGGSVELALLSEGFKVEAYDAFAELVNFWQQLKSNAVQLTEAIKDLHPLSREDFYKLQKTDLLAKSLLIKAAAQFYALNRASFSGSTLSGGMSPAHPRFTLELIEKLKLLDLTQMQVRLADFEQSIISTNLFLYLDPPYLIKTNLYGTKGSMHKGFDHEKLAKILRTKSRWIMSYNDCPEIRNLYKDYEIQSISWAYGMNKSKQSSEVLIFST